ncbi:hypothetical protein RJ641_020076, partial [Dillenia turbinata]
TYVDLLPISVIFCGVIVAIILQTKLEREPAAQIYAPVLKSRIWYLCLGNYCSLCKPCLWLFSIFISNRLCGNNWNQLCANGCSKLHTLGLDPYKARFYRQLRYMHQSLRAGYALLASGIIAAFANLVCR